MNLGKLSYWIGRTGVQANKIIVPANFFMLVYLTTKENPMWMYLIPAALIGGIIFMLIDRKNIVGNELAHWFDLNPRFKQMQKDIEEIKNELAKSK